MDPLDPVRNEEGGGLSKRRISSILKAPRKSIRFPDPEQQENVVECAKPVEKRNSRRVSFAPANNVLLFSNDVKNGSPARSPLQDIMTTAAGTQNRVQVAFTEDVSQQIAGMETLMNAPFHTSEPWDEGNFDSRDNIGEKTVMFSPEDASMDMTHSQTINIANDAELLADISLQNNEILPTNRERTMIFTADNGSMDMTLSHTGNIFSMPGFLPTSLDLNAEKKNIPSSMPCLDPDFEKFLASVFKPSGSSSNLENTRVTSPAGASSEQANNPLTQIKTPNSNKENQSPAFVAAVMEKSLNASRKMDQSSGNIFWTKNNATMDMTKADAGHNQRLPEDKQQMYPHLDHVVQQPNSKEMASFNYKDKMTSVNPSCHASQQSDMVTPETKDEYKEKGMMFSADDEFMDMTQSHTVNITMSPPAPATKNQTYGKMRNNSTQEEKQQETFPTSLANCSDVGFKDFLASLSKTSVPHSNPDIARMATSTSAFLKEDGDKKGSLPKFKTDVSKDKGTFNTATSFGDAFCPEDDVSMDMTEAQTGLIVGWDDDEVFPPSENHKKAEHTSEQKILKAPRSSNGAGVDLSLKPSLKTQGHQFKFDAEDDRRDRTVRFSADNACMDVTQSHTVSIATDFAAHDVFAQSCDVKKGDRTLGQQGNKAMRSSNYKGVETTLTAASRSTIEGHQVKVDAGEKTVRFTADDACMDVTQSHTVGIVSDLDMHPCQSFSSLPAYGEKTVRFGTDDAAMDVTKSHTVNIASGFDPQSHPNLQSLPACGEKTVRFSTDDAAMDVTKSYTANIATGLDFHPHKTGDFLPSSGEKTVRFSANDAAMDVTQSHTVNIVTGFDSQPHPSVPSLPAYGEKTVRFNANDAAMDVTKSHTVNIATGLDPHQRQDFDIPVCGEKTVRFGANDAAMDVTKSHTVNIATGLHPHKNGDLLPSSGEKTVRFNSSDAAMDVTQCNTINIATGFDPQAHQSMDFLSACGEKTVTFPANAAAMDVTQSHTVNIACNSATDSLLPQRDATILSSQKKKDFPLFAKNRKSETSCPGRNRPSSAHNLDPGFKSSLSKRSGTWANPVIIKAASAALTPADSEDTEGVQDYFAAKRETPVLVNSVTENPERKIMADCPEEDVRVAEAQTEDTLGQKCADEPPHCAPSTQVLYSNSGTMTKTKATSPKGNGSSSQDCEEITTRKGYRNSNESNNKEEHEARSQTCSPESADHVDAGPSRKSKRMSFADLHTKIRRLSHMIHVAPDAVATEGCTAPLPQPEHDLDPNSKDKTQSQPVKEPELEMASGEHKETGKMEEEPTTNASATPFKLKSKQLMSRLSMGGFKPKLPQRSKLNDAEKANSAGDHTRTITVSVTDQLQGFDADVSDIYDEELGSCEDISEMLETKSPHKATEKVSPSQEFYTDGLLEDNVFEEESTSGVNGKKKLLPLDENNTEDEKRLRASPEMAADIDMDSQAHQVECDTNMTSTAGMTTQATDEYSSSHTASMRCEAAFESTLKQSLFESQLEEYANDMQQKFDDGTITVLEFFKLFNIDFVIHNPRQSILPERLLSDTERTPMDLLKDRHIYRPRHLVYEKDVFNLTERVDGLKVRMRDLDRNLRSVNRTLWEDICNSSEEELKAFGAKLKERNNLFRKRSKAQSHEMKEVLYSNLVQANVEEQQRLRGKINEADEMIKSLDDCIHELKTELTAINETGSKDSPSLKSQQEELKSIMVALADNERQISELELQEKQTSKKLNRLKTETKNLKNHVSMLHLVNEWRLGESRDNCTVYTFLHETFHLQLVYETGNIADNQSARKIKRITFKHQIDEEKSQDHACLVHKLLAQYIEGESAWVEKYPTSRHIPKLLHDVGLVVSSCRLLGEELRLLNMRGSLKFDVLNISCVDTQVHFVFSSLKKLCKFEVIFSASLTEHLYSLHVQTFRNIIGSTTIQQVEEIVASFSPCKNLLTKIVKRIHESFLR